MANNNLPSTQSTSGVPQSVGGERATGQFVSIVYEIATIKNPDKLSAIAAERKSSMMLLPYGIPIAIGTILYFACTGLLV